MLVWFREHAPIRSKMRTVTGLNVALVAGTGSVCALGGALGSVSAPVQLAAIGGAALLTAAVNAVLSRAIVRPYVTTVMRMEALAAGDLDSPVQFTQYRDCVGRLTTALASFRAGALERIRLEEDAAQSRKRMEAERARSAQEAAERLKVTIIDAVAQGLGSLAAGDLTFRMTRALPAEYETLRADFNKTAGTLENALQQIVSATDTLRTGTDSISRSSADLSRRTEQQAASLEETAAALDQITATVRRTAEHTVNARSTVASATEDAKASGQTVQDAMQAMQEIETASRAIGQIIGMIDEIAFQTNLLALNAGVEAARAGDAGRGFAVVATEVRALAQRSAAAAKEIKDLISSSGEQVQRGAGLVNAAGAALQRIVAHVDQLSGLVSDIAHSAREQSTGLQEINTAVNQMDRMTQQNAAMVEQSHGATQSLAQETAGLAQLVSRFRVNRYADAFGDTADNALPVPHRATVDA